MKMFIKGISVFILALGISACTTEQKQQIQDGERAVNECLNRPAQEINGCLQRACDSINQTLNPLAPRKQVPGGSSRSISSPESSLNYNSLMSGVVAESISIGGEEVLVVGGSEGAFIVDGTDIVGVDATSSSWKDRGCGLYSVCCSVGVCPADRNGICGSKSFQ